MMRKALFLACFLLLNFANICFAQGESAVLEPRPEDSSSVSDPQGEKVTLIEIIGNKSTSTNTVLSKMKTRVGGIYQKNIISDDLKRLYILGFFSDIKIDTESYNGGVKVIINVKERPIIEKISFTGMKRLRRTTEKLKEELKSKEGQYLDYPSLAEDVRMLKKSYEKKGFSDVAIDYQITADKETNQAKVVFKVEEGKRIFIKNILVEGNEFFSDSRVLRLIKTKRAWLLNTGVLKDELLQEDMERIKAFYRRNGFTDVSSDFKVSPDSKKPNRLYVTIEVNEGKRYLVGNITMQGNKDIQKKDLLAKLKECVPGKVFSQEALDKDISEMLSLYFDRGYIAAQIQETVSLNSYTGRVDITYNIIENQIFYVDKVKIRGNVKTKDLVIRREMRIYPGNRFDGGKLRRSKERLYNLGFFEEVSYDTQETSAADKKDLVVEVKESKTGTLSFGGGYSTVDEFVGFIEVEQKNFDWKNFPYFTGAGQNLKLRASFGTVSAGYDLSFTEPWLFDYPVSFGFDFYKRKRERESDIGYGYDEDITGGDLRLGREISEYVNADIMYRYDQIDITNISVDATNDLMSEQGKNAISSVKASLSFDDRDNVFSPRTGDLVSGSFEVAGGPFAGDKDFWKFYSRASHYFPLPFNSSLELRARVAAGEPYGNSDKVPIYERLFAGGTYTVRGYEERKLGPIDPVSKDPLGGESMVIGNIEYTYPLFDFLKVAAFIDSGNVWSKLSDIGTGGFKSGVGIGARLKTPIGPIMLDFGIPLNKEPGEEKRKNGRLHFSASHGF